jgi:glutamate carboxypeptidase
MIAALRGLFVVMTAQRILHSAAMSESLEAVVERARARAGEILPMLRRWVETNSYSANVAGVNAMGDLLVDSFDLDGLSVERHPGDRVGDHLVFTTGAFAGAGANARLVLIGHHDTVFPPDAFDVWEERGDRLRGPGVLDMKGGLATVWAALAALADAGSLADLPIAFVSVGDEEIGSVHSAELLRETARGAAGALVFEAGRAGDAIITRRKGTGALEVTARGKSAHAGNHHADGVNAIWAMARFVDRVQRLTDYDAGVTVNVGLIEGGEARNTVAPVCVCGVDFRFLDAAAGESVVAAARAIAVEVGDSSGAVFSVDGGIRRMPLERTDASAALCRRYADCAIAAGLGGPEADLIGGGSDANTVSAIGVPAIDGLGPRGAGFHTHDEHISISSLALRAEALARFLVSWR